MNQIMNLTFASSLTNLCEKNSSFDSGVLRIAYTGANRNNSYIDKDTFERCAASMYNCPVVTHYDRETNSIGGHDVEVVVNHEGELELVNLTIPVGVVPESANYYWEEVTEDNGIVHEYLCTEVLLWKRQEAYSYIKNSGITAQSMEISVKDGETIDGLYHIYDFEFNAFALISVEPCFESAALATFSARDFKQQMTEMMQDLKDSFSMVDTSKEDNDIHPQELSEKGGELVLDEKMELVSKYGINLEDLDFSIEDFSVEELTEKFEAINSENIPEEQPDVAEGTNEAIEEVAEELIDETHEEQTEVEEDHESYELSQNIQQELERGLCQKMFVNRWGETVPEYSFVDFDPDKHEVYCWDRADWLLYGFSYAVNGNNVNIDFDTKVRKKYAIVDFDEHSQESPFMSAFESAAEKYDDVVDKYQKAEETITALNATVEDLSAFKANVEKAEATEKRQELFSKFEDLVGVESFESLREDAENYDLETLEEKCFAIRGRMSTVAKFSFESKSIKLPVEDQTSISNDDAPYGEYVDSLVNKIK